MNIELYTIDENITNEISEKIKNIKFKDIKTEKSEISQKKFSPFQGKYYHLKINLDYYLIPIY